MNQTQTDTAPQDLAAPESNPLLLPSLDDHPEIQRAYEVKTRCEAAFAEAKAALEHAQHRVRQIEAEQITALLQGGRSPSLGTASAAVSEAERAMRVAYRATETATTRWKETREKIRRELMAACKTAYLQHAAEAIAAAERACQLHTQLSRLYSRMSTLCGPLDFPDLHYVQLQADFPLPAGQYQGWHQWVRKSGLLPQK